MREDALRERRGSSHETRAVSSFLMDGGDEESK